MKVWLCLLYGSIIAYNFIENEILGNGVAFLPASDAGTWDYQVSIGIVLSAFVENAVPKVRILFDAEYQRKSDGAIEKIRGE